ncbi:uncharacterized protein BX664DRAFT_364690 [Halteromyces radiatus]|uniref:uncharacterized protein n=1 Tax=Halteromyces radiatus TaxID=101107 RepID=UPI00221E7EE0|nr:uncharacterized protein BX664DRAFT_364690 [Halteromyces radiatus]KAI8092901.1 hypothetical protein BX664DRAFT_364690 [Halteromyces radiatus]
MATTKWVPLSKIAHGIAISPFTPTSTSTTTSTSSHSRPITVYSTLQSPTNDINSHRLSTASSDTSYSSIIDSTCLVPLEVGDELYIFEQCGAWYRGYVLSSLEEGRKPNKAPNGIFPATHVQIKEYVDFNSSDQQFPTTTTTTNDILPLSPSSSISDVMSRSPSTSHLDPNTTLAPTSNPGYTSTTTGSRPSSGLDIDNNISSPIIDLQFHQHYQRIRSRSTTTVETDQDQVQLKRPPPPSLPMIRFDQSTVTGADEPLVDEIAACVTRRQLLDQALSREELARLRKEIIQRMVTMNISQYREMIIRHPERGFILDIDSTSVATLYFMHWKYTISEQVPITALFPPSFLSSSTSTSSTTTATTSSSSSQESPDQTQSSNNKTSSTTRQTSPRPHLKKKRAYYHYKGGEFHHLFFDLKACVAHICQPGEWTELRFSLYSSNQAKFITEQFVVHLNYNGMPKDERQIGKLQSLFVDLGAQDLNEHLYLVCYIFRLGGMKFIDKEKDTISSLGRNGGGYFDHSSRHHQSQQSSSSTSHESTTLPSLAHTNLFRRPFGCAVLNVGSSNNSGYYHISPSEHDMRIYTPTSESTFAHLHEDIIWDNQKEVTQNPRAEMVCVFLRMFYGQRDEVLKANAALLQDIPLTARIGFPDVVFPDDERNELYITLNSGDFAHFGRTRNIQVIICVRDNQTGEVVEMGVAVGSGTPMASTWESAIYYHDMKPTWNEMVKVKISDIQVWQRSHIFLVVKHRSRHGGGASSMLSNNNNISGGSHHGSTSVGVSSPLARMTVEGNTSSSDKILAMGYIPLFIPPLSHDFVADGTHTLCLYKYDRQLLHPSSYFGVVPWCNQSTSPSNMQGQESMLTAIHQANRQRSVGQHYANTSHSSVKSNGGNSIKNIPLFPHGFQQHPSHSTTTTGMTGVESSATISSHANSSISYSSSGTTSRPHAIRDSLIISTFLCSTRFTQNATLVQLINWRSTVEESNFGKSVIESVDELLVMLDKFTFVGEQEVVKFLADIFDALLDILVYRVPDNIEKQNALHDQVIVAIIWLLSIVQDRRFSNFRPVLNVYINQRFYCSDDDSNDDDYDNDNGDDTRDGYQLYTSYRYRLKHNKSLRRKMTLDETTYNQLLKGLIRLSTDPSDITKAKQLRSSIKVWEYLFRFIERSREMQRNNEDQAEHELRELMYKQDLQQFFDLATKMMGPDQPSSMIGTQTLILQHFSEAITEIKETYSTKEIMQIISNLVDACSHVTGKLVGFKLSMILSIIKAPIFSDKMCCYELGSRVVGWISVWLNSYMTVAKEVIFARTALDGNNNQAEDYHQQTRLPRAQWLENLRLSLTIIHELLDKIRKVRGLSMPGLSSSAVLSSPPINATSSASSSTPSQTRPVSMSTLGISSPATGSLTSLTGALGQLVPQLLQTYKDLQRLTNQAIQATTPLTSSTSGNKTMSSATNKDIQQTLPSGTARPNSRHSLTVLRERANSIRGGLPQVVENGPSSTFTDHQGSSAHKTTTSFPVVLQALATSPTRPFPSVFPFQANTTSDAALMAGSDLAAMVASGLMDLTVVLLDLLHLTPAKQWMNLTYNVSSTNKANIATDTSGVSGPEGTADYLCTLCFVCMSILFGDDVHKLNESRGTLVGYDALQDDPTRERRKWPKNWLNLDVVAHKIVLLDVMTPMIALLGTETFLPKQQVPMDNHFGDKKDIPTHSSPDTDIMVRLWRTVFMSLVRVLASPSLEVETLLPQAQRAVWKLAGNIRGEQGTAALKQLWELAGSSWNAVGTLKKQPSGDQQHEKSKDLKMKPQLLAYFDHHGNASREGGDGLSEFSTDDDSGDDEGSKDETKQVDDDIPPLDDNKEQKKRDVRQPLPRYTATQIHLDLMPVLLRPLCSASLTLHDKLRSTTVGMIADLIAIHMPKSYDPTEGRNLLIGTIDKLVMTYEKGSDEIRVKWVMELNQALQARLTTEKEQEWGRSVVNSLDNLMELLLQIRSLPMDSAEFMDERINATLKLMKFIQVCERQEIYIKYVHQLVDLHLNSHNYVEAALTLRFHADLMPWDPYGEVEAIPELGFDAQSPFARKRRLYDTMLTYLDKGTAWELCVDLCRELCDQYALTISDYHSCSNTLRRQATFLENIVNKERYFSEYFRVGFYGRGFPASIRNQQFIYRGMAWEKMASFVERMQNRHPNAQVLSGKMASSCVLSDEQVRELESELDGQYMQITAVTPVMNPQANPVLTNPLVDEKVLKYYHSNNVSQFTYSRPVTRHDDDNGNDDNQDGNEQENMDGDDTSDLIEPPILSKQELDFLHLWTEKTTFTSEDSFPTIALRSKILSIELEEISPIENAVDAMIKKTHELVNLEKKYEVYVDNPQVPFNLNPFSMALNGAVDAPVNGGVPLYKKAFLSPYYGKKHPHMRPWITQLKKAIDEQVVVIDRCLDTHNKLVSNDMKPFHSNLVELYKKNFVDDISQLKRRGTTFKSAASSTGATSVKGENIKEKTNPSSPSRVNLTSSASHSSLHNTNRRSSSLFREMERPLMMKSRTNSITQPQQTVGSSTPTSNAPAGTFSSLMSPKSSSSFAIPTVHEEHIPRSNDRLPSSSTGRTTTANTPLMDRESENESITMSAPTSPIHPNDHIPFTKSESSGLSKSLKMSIRKATRKATTYNNK